MFYLFIVKFLVVYKLSVSNCFFLFYINSMCIGFCEVFLLSLYEFFNNFRSWEEWRVEFLFYRSRGGDFRDLSRRVGLFFNFFKI